MGSWGKVTLCCVYKENVDTLEPWVVLLDGQGDVIYCVETDSVQTAGNGAV